MLRYVCLFCVLVSLAPVLYAEDLCQTAARAMETAEKIRGLKRHSSVECLVRDKENIKKYVVEAVTTETPPERIRGEGIALKALGIVPESFHYEEELINLYSSQIGGYYDPKRDHFVMAAWIPATLQYPVAVHELVHALQDQHHDLSTFMNARTMTSDELMARSALVEGDATAVMIDYSLRLSGVGTFAEQESTNMFLAQNIIGTQLLGAAEQAPQALLTMMIFPYSSGLRFAHARLRETKSYKTLDDIFAMPPRSTEEILHPEKYGTAEPDFEHPELPADRGTPIHVDSMGEFFLTTWLNSQGVSGADAAKAAAGWGGDTLAVFDGADSYSVLWLLAFDSAEELQEFKISASKIARIDTITCAQRQCALEFSSQK